MSKDYLKSVFEAIMLGIVYMPENEQEAYEYLTDEISFLIKEDLIDGKINLVEAFKITNDIGKTLWDLVKHPEQFK